MKKTPKNYTLHSRKNNLNKTSHNNTNFPLSPHHNNYYVDIFSSDEKRVKKKKRIPILRILSFVFFMFLGILGGMMIYTYNMLHSFNYEEIPYEEGKTSKSEDNGAVDGLFNDNKVLNVLLIGSDSMSAGDHGRSDSLLILSLNIRAKKIKVTSIMRDTWIDIPNYGKDRINASYAYGGPKLTIETLQKNFGILIDRYACVDFEGFSKIIDALGGIDIELTAKESSYINTYSKDKNTLKGAGVKHLTGLQALHHSRNRNSLGSDYDRTMRQREVIKAMIESMKKAGASKITEMISTLAPLITTNFKISEITRLVTRGMTYLNYPVEEYRIPADGNVRDEIYNQKMVLVINNLSKAKSDLKNFIYELNDERK